MHINTRIAMFKRLQAHNPEPTTELHYQTPFELLIAVILSAQATDVSVNKVTRILFAKANTPEALYAIGEQKLKTIIASIGLYNTKAKNIIKTCQLLIDQHDSHVPAERDALEALPGVGRKTANVVLNTAFGQPTIAVDTHIYRVANRTGLAPGNTVNKVEAALMLRVPKPFIQNAHHWLILHGRYTCQARRPRCETCIIADLCAYNHKQNRP